jgi:hypothetical protein
MRQVRADLIQHVGGRPSATQRMLIERAVTKTGYLARLDAEALSPAGLSDHRRREYQAADNSLRLVLRELGIKGVAERQPTLQDYVASRASRAHTALEDEDDAAVPEAPEAAGDASEAAA